VVDVVIDTVVFVRSLINPKSIWGELVFRRRDRYRLIVSQAIVAELYDVMERPEVARTFRFVATEGPDTIRELIVEAVLVDPMALP
jgi:predicted nucleic acid-binding protein